MVERDVLSVGEVLLLDMYFKEDLSNFLGVEVETRSGLVKELTNWFIGNGEMMSDTVTILNSDEPMSVWLSDMVHVLNNVNLIRRNR